MEELAQVNSELRVHSNVCCWQKETVVNCQYSLLQTQSEIASPKQSKIIDGVTN